MFKSKKSLKKTIEGQAKYIIELEEKVNSRNDVFVGRLKQIQEINNKPTPSKNNWKLRQKLINNKIDDIISFYEK